MQFEDSIYDDEEAVRFIQSHLPQEAQGKYTDDDIALITDIMVEYLDVNGLLAADPSEEIVIDVEDMLAYVVKACKKDKDVHFDTDPELLRWVVECELDYEESLE